MSTKMLRYRMIESIKLLASEGNIQLSCFPDFVCKGDEIANSLGDWLTLYQQKTDHDTEYVFYDYELEQIIGIDQDISMLAPEDFSEDAILNSCKWDNIRKKARNLLILLNEEYTLPDKKSV